MAVLCYPIAKISHGFVHVVQCYHFIDDDTESKHPSEAKPLLSCSIVTKSQVWVLCFHVLHSCYLLNGLLIYSKPP